MRTGIAFGWARVACVGLIGCGTGCQLHERIDGYDDGAIFPTARASISLSGENRGGFLSDGFQRPQFEEIIRGLISIDAEATGAHGDDTQILDAADTIDIDGETITGPGTAHHDFHSYWATVSLRTGYRIAGIVRLEGIAGGGTHHASLDTTLGGAALHESINGLGPLLGGRATVEIQPWLAAYGQASVLFGFSSAGSWDMEFYELGVQLAPIRNAAVFAGWRRSNFEHEANAGSDIAFDLAGPVIGLELRF
jgi:hypothetical protein